MNIHNSHSPLSETSPGKTTSFSLPVHILQAIKDLVDEDFYYGVNPDVRDAGVSAFEHFIIHGHAEGRNPNADFDMAFYKLQFPELNNTAQNPLEHYVSIGKRNGAIYKMPTTLLRNHNGTFQELREAALPDESCKLIAWYLPQFHPIGENDTAWGMGFTEWTNVAAAKPRFTGHYQPKLPGSLGFYDLRRQETLEEQIMLAKHAGIYGFCFHHYWFEGHKILRTPLEHLRDNPSLNIPFCLHWANEAWTRRWDGSNQGVIIPQGHSPEDDFHYIKDIAWALRDERYIRFQGKPVLGIYRPDLFPDISATLERWRTYCHQEKIGDIFLFSSMSFSNTAESILEQGFDGMVEYPPHALHAPVLNAHYASKGLEFSGRVCNYTQARDSFLQQTAGTYETPRFRGVMPGWDNSARTDTGAIYDKADPQKYKEWLQTSIAWAKKDQFAGEKYLFLNAWNEWAESAYLEPDATYGSAILNATAEAIDTKPHLPRILFVCDLENQEQERWLENTLRKNLSSPLYKPVVFVPKPLHSIGTFKGLAPMICSFANANAITIKKLFAKSGHSSFALCMLAHTLSEEQAQGIMEISNLIILCRQGIEQSIPATQQPAPDIWVADNASTESNSWRLQHRATQKQSSLPLLLRRISEQNKNNVEITAIVLPPKQGEVSLGTLQKAQQTSRHAMQIIVPQIMEESCKGHLTCLQGIPAKNENEYLYSALQEAKGKLIWIIDPEQKIYPDLPNVAHAPFAQDTIACTRTYFPPQHENIVHLFDKHTMVFSQGELDAPNNLETLHGQINMMMFEKKHIADTLRHADINKNILQLIVQACYHKYNMALVPWEGM